jgi:hypothetical protein
MIFASKGKRRSLTAIALLCIFLLASAGCKNPEGPDSDVMANLFISNECGVAIDVFMDGDFQFSIEFLYYEVIQNVSRGVYEIAAKKKGTEDFVSTNSVDVSTSGDYWVTILSPASLKVINDYGQTLNIYTNGSYQGELDDKESQVFTNVPYGTHVLEAAKKSDNSLVAAADIEIVENKEYTWTIK